LNWLQGVPPRPFYTISAPAQEVRGERPRITVATVVWNAVDSLPRTLDSVASQTGIDFEYVVVDGASTDGSLDVLKSREGIDVLISEPDTGPYSAMNKAAYLATGEFIIFMNAGDTFTNPRALADLAGAYEDGADFIAGHHVYLPKDGRQLYNRVDAFDGLLAKLRSGSLTYHWRGRIPGHQATATRVSLLRELRYSSDFGIAADHELMFRAAAGGSRFATSDSYVALYEGGGLSARQPLACLKEWAMIGLQHSRDKSAVRRFYAPELLAQLARATFAKTSIRDRLGVIVGEWRWIVFALRSLRFRQILLLLRRTATPAALRKTGTDCDGASR
jgi:glycosyltransferase involved in cell wall biosynthesis